MYVEYKKEVDKLIAANFTREQAEAIMQQIENQQIRSIGELATARQLQDTCNELKNELKQDISKMQLELIKEISEMKQELLKVASEAKIEAVKLQQEQKYNFRLMLGIVTLAMLASPYVPNAIRYFSTLLR